MIKPGILLFVCLLTSWFSFCQASVDFSNKALLKALQKEGIENLSSLHEIKLSDETKSSNQINGKYFLINKENISQFIYVGRVNSCRAGGCSASDNMHHDENSEYFDYYILFDSKKTVQVVKVFNYQATHGQEITSKGWLSQFIGYSGSEPLQVNKDIDAISGATISVYAITYDVGIKTAVLQSLQ